MRAWVLAACAGLAATFGLVIPPAIGSQAAGAPLPIETASLTQDGQQLLWRLRLADSFSPGALARDHRALCLLIERAAGDRPAGRACLTGPRPGSKAPGLTYTGVGSTESLVIDATVMRTSSRDLSAEFLPSAVGASYGPLRWQVISTLAARACASSTSQASCATAYPAKPALLRLHRPQLVGCFPDGPSWIFHGPARVREIALTFDDGPWSDTRAFLGVLEREHVVATFFQIGDQISRYGEHGVDRRMLADGDMIGDHTWNYGGDIVAGGADAAVQISEAAAAIRTATGGFEPCLFRAPGGNVSPALLYKARSLGFATIQWDVDPRDWTTPGTASIYDNVIANAHDGAIVIQHDGGGDRSETLAALPAEIDTLRRIGYRFVTLTQMLGYRLVYR